MVSLEASGKRRYCGAKIAAYDLRVAPERCAKPITDMPGGIVYLASKGEHEKQLNALP